MFDKYMIYDAECKNVVKDGKVTGFQVGVRVTYYRGIIIALIKNFEVTVDGVKYTKDDMTFTFNGNHTYTFDEMFGVTDERWGFGDVAVITVNKDGGLTPGEHEIEVTEELRVSYGLMENYFPNKAHWKKKINIA